MLTSLQEQFQLTEQQIELLTVIKDEQDRGSMNIVVLGEFSVGKSSLINRLLGFSELLPTKLTETTAILTTIVHSDQEERACVEFWDSRNIDIPLEAVLELVHGNQDVNEIKSLTIYLNNEYLPNEVVIIDTPGSNVIYEKHIKMAERAIITADRALFVTNKASLSQSEIEYLHYILELQPNVTIVVNQVDRFINPDEGETLNEIIARVEQDLKQALEITPIVIATSTKDMIGIDELRHYMFRQILDHKHASKTISIKQKLRNLLISIHHNLEQQYKVLSIRTEHGTEALKLERSKLEAQHQRIHTIISTETATLASKWLDLSEKYMNLLKIKSSKLEEELVTKQRTIHMKDDVLTAIGEIVNEIRKLKRIFITDATVEIEQQCTEDFELINRTIEESKHQENQLKIRELNLDELQYNQQREFSELVHMINNMKDDYSRIEGLLNQGEFSNYDQQVEALHRQIERINEQLSISYSPTYRFEEGNNKGLFQEFGKVIGKIGDIVIALVPIAGSTTLGKKIAEVGLKQGLKGVTKEVVKETIKEATNTAIKQKTNSLSLMGQPQNPLLQILNQFSLEHNIQQFGLSLDNALGNNDLLELEDMGQRERYMGNRNNLELEKRAANQELNRVKEKLEARSSQDATLFMQLKQQENIMKEKERKLIELEREQQQVKATMMEQHWQKQFYEYTRELIARIEEDLRKWFYAQAHFVRENMKLALVQHYDTEINLLKASISEIDHNHETLTADLKLQFEQFEHQLNLCNTLMLEVEQYERASLDK